jgi:hypothetical protein
MKVISYQCLSISSFIGGVLKPLLKELRERESQMKRTRTKRMCFFFEGKEMRKEKDMGGVSLLLKWDLVGGGLFGI